MKRTFNWGHRLLLVFLVFGVGMSWLVYQCVHTNFDLVSKEYYKDELDYQRVIEGKRNWSALNTTIETSQTGESIRFQFPSDFQGTTLRGTALFYCTVDAKRDKQYELAVDVDGRQVIRDAKLHPGKYTLKMNWTANDRYYYAEQTMEIK